MVGMEISVRERAWVLSRAFPGERDTRAGRRWGAGPLWERWEHLVRFTYIFS